MAEPTAASVDTSARAGTGSNGTRVLGVASILLVAALVLFGLVLTDPAPPPPEGQGDSMRLIYVHVPAAMMMYIPFTLTLVGSIVWLVKRSVWWDTVAGAAAEIGVVLTAMCLVTGSLWGRPTWGTYWDWDPRLTSTALMFLVYLGYLAIRRIPADVEVRNRRAAVVGIAGFVNVPIVHFAVDWWRSLHQDATIGTLDVKIQGLQLFTLFLGFVAFGVTTAWLLLHRFRLAWLEDRADEALLEAAIEARRAEASL